MASSLLRRRRVWVPLVVVIFLVAVGAALYLRGQAPPEAARLLPENDGVIYVDLKPLRTYHGAPTDLSLANSGAGLALLGGSAHPEIVISGNVQFVFVRPSPFQALLASDD